MSMRGTVKLEPREDADASRTSSTIVEDDREDPDLVRYKPVEFEADKGGHVGEVVKKSKVVSSETLTAGLHLSTAMSALSLAKNALRRSNDGAASMARAAGKEMMRREYLVSTVGSEANRLFQGLVLEVEGLGEPSARRGVSDVERALLNEIGRLRSGERVARARERSANNDLALRNAEIRSWAREYDTTVKELKHQVKQDNDACRGYWPERFPTVELPKALADMDRAVEVLRWLTRTGAGVEVGGSDRFGTTAGGEGEKRKSMEAEDTEDSDAGWETGAAVLDSTRFEEPVEEMMGNAVVSGSGQTLFVPKRK